MQSEETATRLLATRSESDPDTLISKLDQDVLPLPDPGEDPSAAQARRLALLSRIERAPIWQNLENYNSNRPAILSALLESYGQARQQGEKVDLPKLALYHRALIECLRGTNQRIELATLWYKLGKIYKELERTRDELRCFREAAREFILLRTNSEKERKQAYPIMQDLRAHLCPATDDDKRLRDKLIEFGWTHDGMTTYIWGTVRTACRHLAHRLLQNLRQGIENIDSQSGEHGCRAWLWKNQDGRLTLEQEGIERFTDELVREVCAYFPAIPPISFQLSKDALLTIPLEYALRTFGIEPSSSVFGPEDATVTIDIHSWMFKYHASKN